MQKETASAPNKMVVFKEDKGSPGCLSKCVLLGMKEGIDWPRRQFGRGRPLGLEGDICLRVGVLGRRWGHGL